jgi:hypothetical protein
VVKQVYEIIKLNQEAQYFLGGVLLSPHNLGVALGEVMREATGAGGIFARHLQEGQSEWPKLAPATVRRKGNSEIFVQSGRVKRSITQSNPETGPALKFGSSADITAGQPVAMQYSSHGLFVRIKAHDQVAQMWIGFLGKFKLSKLFRRGVIGAKKHVAVGSRGFIRFRRPSGRQKYISKIIPVQPGENLAYANVVQTGKFLGVRGRSGMLINPRVVAAAKRIMRTEADAMRRQRAEKLLRKQGAATFTAELVFGTARPLLPATRGDVVRLAAAFERGVQKVFRAAGM